VGLRPIACWDCGFKSRQGHGCLSFLSVVFCQAEVSGSGRSLVQRNPTDCDVSEYDREASTGTSGALAPYGGGGGNFLYALSDIYEPKLNPSTEF